MNGASVRSIEALKDFRAALAIFVDDAKHALESVDGEIRRASNWLLRDQKAYWQAEIKRREQAVTQARAEVHKRKMSMSGNARTYSEQQEILDRAVARLREAERRADLVRKWTPKLEQAILEYHSRSNALEDMAHGDLPRALLQLERMLDALDAYLHTEAPTAGRAVPTASASTAAPASSGTPAASTAGAAPSDASPPAGAEAEAGPTGGEAAEVGPEGEDAS